MTIFYLKVQQEQSLVRVMLLWKMAQTKRYLKWIGPSHLIANGISSVHFIHLLELTGSSREK
jgi:hypothetical protein